MAGVTGSSMISAQPRISKLELRIADERSKRELIRGEEQRRGFGSKGGSRPRR